MLGTVRVRRSRARSGLARTALGTVAAAVLGVAALSGCAAGMISQTADQIPNHDGVHSSVGPMGIQNALLGSEENGPGPVAFPAGSAVPVSFVVTNASTDTDTLTSITSSAGEVEIVGDAQVPGEHRLEFTEGGDFQATITSATQDLKYGFAVAMTFNFANAGSLTIDVPIAVPTHRAEGRQGTNIYPAEESHMWDDDYDHAG